MTKPPSQSQPASFFCTTCFAASGPPATIAAMSFSDPVPRPLLSQPEFARGLRDMTGTPMGIAAWGLLTGIAMAKSDLALPPAVLMSVIVFAGSAQRAALVRWWRPKSS